MRGDPTAGVGPPGETGLHVELDVPLPPELWGRAPTLVFVCGWCFHPQARIDELSFVLDGRRQRVM